MTNREAMPDAYTRAFQSDDSHIRNYVLELYLRKRARSQEELSQSMARLKQEEKRALDTMKLKWETRVNSLKER
jgi:hypothetical protein